MSSRSLALHWQILIGMALGVAIGWLAGTLGWQPFVADWIAPFGQIFVRSLKLIAIPLIVVSLIKGVSELRDISSLSRLGSRTLVLYILTTVVAVTIGLVIANVFKPGQAFTAETRAKLMQSGAVQDKAAKVQGDAIAQQEQGPLQPLVDLVPENLFLAASDNRNMLQVITFAVLFGIGLIMIDPRDAGPVGAVLTGLNAVILKMIDIIMLASPIGVFALLADQFAATPTWDVMSALLKYALCVVAGLAVVMFLFYPALVVLISKHDYRSFFRGMAPAQLLAFSTSSSAATLPVTMECVEKNLGVENEIASFVLPIGATVNMDGTSLYQAVAAVFIAQAYGIDLSLAQQLQIILTATLASIGAAAVPGAGMVMLVIVLGAINVPVEGLALIIAVDRILDMCRTTVNVTGDAVVALMIERFVGKSLTNKNE
jgi:proton glutamate symport protein